MIDATVFAARTTAPAAALSYNTRWGRRLGAIALGAALSLAAAAPPSPAQAQNLFAAVAKVNDDIITGYDLRQRAALLRFSEGGDPADAERRALDLLVSESLQLQEGEKRGVEVKDEDLDQALATIARNNRTSTTGLLDQMQKAGVDPDVFKRSIKAQLVWRQLVQGRFGTRMQPSDGEIETAMEQAEKGPKTFDVRQIVVPLPPTAPTPDAARAFGEAEKVRKQLTNCAQIQALAPKYSRISGKVGDLRAEQMPGPIREAVTKLSVGQTAKPMRSSDGVHVIMLCGISDGKVNREQVAARLTDQKGRRLADSYLSELRRAALIETRR